MIIDFHTHVMPPEMAAAPLWQGRCPMTIENVFEAAKAGGIDKTVISNPGHELRHMTADQQLAAIQMINRYLASLAHKHDNIYAMATGQPYGGDKFLRDGDGREQEQGGAEHPRDPPEVRGHDGPPHPRRGAGRAPRPARRGGPAGPLTTPSARSARRSIARRQL